MKEKMLSVSAIKEGTVIDHIAAGCALGIVRFLRLAANERRVTVGFNLKSRSMGLKDLIKVENVFLSSSQTGQVAIFSPQATVNVIENYRVIHKLQVVVPEMISSILSCPNACCATRAVLIPSLFFVERSQDRIMLRCGFCEKSFFREEVPEMRGNTLS